MCIREVELMGFGGWLGVESDEGFKDEFWFNLGD